MSVMEVTRAHVEHLWSRILTGGMDRGDVRASAEALLNLVNAENPWVNRGLTTLHALALEAPLDRLTVEHERWLEQMDDVERDLEAAMTSYFVDLLARFTESYGPARGRTFGEKLVASGHITEETVDVALRARP